MKSEKATIPVILSEFHNKGWVNLDEILKLLTKEFPKLDPSSTSTNELSTTANVELRRKITALMELYKLPVSEQMKIFEDCTSGEMLGKLHDEWVRKVKGMLGVCNADLDDTEARKPQEDYSKYVSGNHDRKTYL